MDVGVIGLGAMGGRMAATLTQAGHHVLAYDISARALQRAVDAGSQAAISCAEVGSSSQIILVSLPGPAEVRQVVSGGDGILINPSRDLVVVDTSTVDPTTTVRLATAAATVGVQYLDAPILGRPDACGSWTFPVGGDPAALDLARPVLEAISRTIVHVGPAGTGNAIKLLNNLMFGAINAITAEVIAACTIVGVSPRTFYDTVAGSEAATVSPLFRAVGKKILENDYDPVFTVDLMHKDVSLAMAMLDKERACLIVGNAVLSLIGLARAAGHGDKDSSAVIKVYEALLGLSPS